jgi:hypothetical protein
VISECQNKVFQILFKKIFCRMSSQSGKNIQPAFIFVYYKMVQFIFRIIRSKMGTRFLPSSFNKKKRHEMHTVECNDLVDILIRCERRVSSLEFIYNCFPTAKLASYLFSQTFLLTSRYPETFALQYSSLWDRV